MANKRMFSLSVVDTDNFLEMPISSRLLYYELGMRADDDGFVDDWKKILLFTGLKDDDMKVLIAKSFVIPFESGVIVIRHWRMNNYLQKDRLKPTIHQEELKQLQLDDNCVYTLNKTNIKSVDLKEEKKENIDSARQKRIQAKKESNLPYSFEYKIRNAFIGKICPICNREMNATSDKNKPTIQHNKPISLGGKHEIDNISVICSNCNCSIQNRVETPPYNTEEVKEIWDCIGNVYTDKNSIDKNSIVYNIYGEFQNVKLTDEEYNKLKDKNLLSYIEDLSRYLANHPRKKYASHYATILAWNRKNNKNNGSEILENFDKNNKVEKISKEEQEELNNILKEMESE